MAPDRSTWHIRREIASAAIAASVAVALSSCGGSGEAQPPANAPAASQPTAPEAANIVQLGLSEKDDRATLEVEQGTTIVVQLPSNPSTGYSWSLVTSGMTTLTVGEPTYAPAGSEAANVGAGGVESWSITAQARGEQELRFEYRRPWERDQPAAKTISYAIRVR